MEEDSTDSDGVDTASPRADIMAILGIFIKSWSLVCSAGLQEIRRQCGVYGAKELEEVWMFGKKNEEKVDQWKRMHEEIWWKRRFE